MFDSDLLNRLYRYCRSLCDQESDAFDLLQGGVERCLRSPPADGAALPAYARRVIRNLFIDQHRGRAGVELEPYDDGQPAAVDFDLASLEEVVISRQSLDEVWPALTVSEREILFLWAVEGYTTAEVAEQLGRPRNTILSIIHRMRERLQARDPRHARREP